MNLIRIGWCHSQSWIHTTLTIIDIRAKVVIWDTFYSNNKFECPPIMKPSVPTAYGKGLIFKKNYTVPMMHIFGIRLTRGFRNGMSSNQINTLSRKNGHFMCNFEIFLSLIFGGTRGSARLNETWKGRVTILFPSLQTALSNFAYFPKHSFFSGATVFFFAVLSSKWG